MSSLRDHPLLSSEAPPPGEAPRAADARWLATLSHDARPALVCEVSMALHAACRAGAEIAVLPCYLGDADPSLEHLPMPDPPSDPLWVTVHKDMRDSPRVRAVLDFLVRVLTREWGAPRALP